MKEGYLDQRNDILINKQNKTSCTVNLKLISSYYYYNKVPRKMNPILVRMNIIYKHYLHK